MTPKMQHGTVEMVSPEWIMQNADHSVDGFEDVFEGGIDYLDMMMDKAADCHFPDILNTIMSQGFRIPIVMVTNYHSYRLTHGNGHHRFVAALLLGLDKIPVYWSDYAKCADYMCEDASEGDDLIESQEFFANDTNFVWGVLAPV